MFKPGILRILVVLLTVGLLATAGSAVAQQIHGRGFVPPANWDQILEDHRVLLPMDKDPLPSNYDWRAHEGVTPPKDQGSCGSCWAFAAAGEMEAKIRIYYGRTLDLSEQQIVSCNPYGAGCDGGWAGSAYYVFMHYGGVLENCMPYEGSDLIACRQDEYLKFTTMDTWVSISNNVEQIKTAVFENGPVCTAVDANDAWDGYSGGVIDAPGSGTNHLVLIVGWDDRMGTNGAWIVKNSWGAGWGDAGYCYVEYGACNMGQGVTSMQYTPPPVDVGVSSPVEDELIYGDTPVTITWYTGNEPVDAVDLYFGTVGSCQDQVIAENVPNTGSFEWLLPNVTTDRATVLVFPSEGTERGFGFTEGEFSVLGHQTRYVSSSGSNQPPYDTPAKAAHSIADAALAGAGRDTVLIAGGDYLESAITVNSQIHLQGGWNADFTVHDPAATPTRLRGLAGTVRFNAESYDYCGVSHITFAECRGSVGTVPVNGRHGAAIIALDSSPLIEHCIFENNWADNGTGPAYGGSILAHGGTPVIEDCTFTGGVGSHGGAIALSQCDGAQITDCGFYANANSDSTAGYFGAAIYVDGGSVIITGSEIRGGGAGSGGAIAAVGGASVTMRDGVVADNRSMQNGAGLYVQDGDLELLRVAVTGNSSWSGTGAGIHAAGGSLTLCNVEVRDNSTSNIGGGIYAQNIDGGVIRNVLGHGNSGTNGGGAFIMASGSLEFYNNAFTGNTGGGLYIGGAGLVSDCNLAFDNIGGDFVSGQTPTDMVADPVYADPAAGDFVPGLHSPLLDSGSVAAGGDWDGGHADRGLHGGPDALPSGPGRVTGLAGALAGDQLDLTWDTNPDAVTYVVYRGTDETFHPAADLVVATVAAPATTCTVTVPDGDWYFLVCAVNAPGHAGGFSDRYESSGGSVPVEDAGLPKALAITTVAPNPFNPRATVSFAVPASGAVRLQVFDLRGRLIETLHDGTLEAGMHTAVWNGTDRQGRQVATGVYFVRLDDGRQAVTTKAVLAK